ncbi:MAG: transposase [Pelatocladus maniniholoensis HA4357-MV3]|uniref:Transposase n=1 Tax=Pelatocladus maniniholoensis HA4357-MV3 TaxID=1117104 RepID=A0A9E3LRW0_9NOST|nr:transposase [Pelatocladus maniniholoensis HA4357-MV3]
MLEKQQKQLLKQGELAPEGSWVARYQVRQNTKRYWYYKLQVPQPYFQSRTSEKKSKYKHLGKAGTDAHLDAFMSVLRRSIFDELKKAISVLDDCLLDITGSEQEEDESQD